ncbi:phage tail protein [Phocoenobacter skyensis]|uniref:Phage tail protein n=2 Tax=Phocoenobacter skyensis TaxID=97481 RepID=A0ABT9JKP9_9PAST|nr:phage tail protein [Pasteurella skyensis]MDP8079508.1 phage tail protein [Pasteurella skyensis]MDP8085380.1 phage tail protein [Pasteurella skyensis]
MNNMGGGGKKGGKPVTVGYRYYWDIHSGLGRGPVDEIVEIRVDDKTAYSCVAGEITQTKAVYIYKPNLFGGDDTGGEGGIVGRMEILMGEPDQMPSTALSNLLIGKHNPEWGPAVGHSKRRSKGNRTMAALIGPQFIVANKNSVAAGLTGEWVAQKGNSILFPDKTDVFVKYKDPKMNEFAKVPTRFDSNAIIPAFRGMVTSFFSGMISAYSAYPKKHSYRVRRAHKGWRDGAVWYPEKCKIILRNDNIKLSGLSEAQMENARQIHAMNPAHILVECATNKSWGGKKEFEELDLDSFKIAADTLFDEGFGLCFRYNRQGSIKQFIQQILDHIGAVQYDNIETGKLAIKLIRQDYDVDKLPLFTYDNGVLSIQDDDTSSSDNTANQIIVTYLDPVSNKENQAIANNLASVRMRGVISKKVTYKGLPTFDLASRIAQRDLEMTASGLMRLKIRFDMRGSELKPGDVFKITLQDRGIEQAILRVGKLENGNEGEIIATCVQDVFGLPETNYSSHQTESLYIPPDYTAKPIIQSKLFEVPYHIFPVVFSEAELAFVKPTDCYIATLASKPSGLSLGFDMQVDAGAGFNTVAECSFTESIIITEAISPHQTAIKFEFSSGYIDLISAYGLIIDDEIIKIEDVDLTTHTLTVGRGCADTIPQPHAENSRAWCYLLSTSGDTTKYTINEQLKVKLLTRTAQETLGEDEADTFTITTQQRQARPYPPANVKVDDMLGADITGTEFKLSWAYRDRDLQQEKLIAHTEESTVLGEGVSYEIALLDNKNVIRKINTTDDNFIYPDSNKVDGETFTEAQLYAVKNGLQSLFKYCFKIKGALIALNEWHNSDEFTAGNSLLNRYNDSDMPGGNYIMLRSSANENSTIYKDFSIDSTQYKRFGLAYKIGSYARRKGQCTVSIQLFKNAEMIKEIVSEKMGNYEKSEWHQKQVLDTLPAGITTIRFRVNVIGDISNNAISFRDIILKGGEEE